tara:strand:- start:441 stop:728 length:288 start_codon:yes stop_codon:yes gene_type:complete
MSKIDTQGMSGPADPNYKGPVRMQPHKPMMIYPHRLHTPQMVKELKILLNEVLDERAGRMNYISYFDESEFAHRINEPEPPYKPNTESYNPSYYQ